MSGDCSELFCGVGLRRGLWVFQSGKEFSLESGEVLLIEGVKVKEEEGTH